jgi:hypothetical protein
VTNPNDTGKFVLVVGEKESSSISEIVRTIGVLPTLQGDFFEKSPWTAFFNLTGVFMLIALAIITAVIILILRLIKRRKKTPQSRA